MLKVRNTNDPFPVDMADLNVDDLIIIANEGEYIEKDIGMLFVDEDQERLDQPTVEGPGWLEIPGASALLQGSPPMDAQGEAQYDKGYRWG